MRSTSPCSTEPGSDQTGSASADGGATSTDGSSASSSAPPSAASTTQLVTTQLPTTTAVPDCQLSAAVVSGERIFDFEGVERRYRLSLPSGYDGTQAAPMVVNLHGFGGTTQKHDENTSMSKVANPSRVRGRHTAGQQRPDVVERALER